MSPWIVVLNVLLGISIMCPIYTYAIYPIILKLLPGRQYARGEFEPVVSVIIVGAEHEDADGQISNKMANLKALGYPAKKLEILEACIAGGTRASAINAAVAKAKGEIIVFTDIGSELGPHSLTLLLQNFSDSRVGVACGMLKKKAGGEGAYWKYENLVKRLESKIGRLSGANKALFGIRKEAVTELADNCINTDFCLSTAALQDDWDAVFDDRAIAYEAEGDTKEKAFQRHVEEGAGHYQALRIFWRLLLPRKGSFTYVSHRVMKWLVPWNMVVAFLCSGALVFNYRVCFLIFIIQIIGYLLVPMKIVLNRKGHIVGGHLGKLLEIWSYFVELNAAFLMGSLYRISR